MAKSKKTSEKAFQRLNTFLRSRGIFAEQPYKLAIRKLLDGEITDEEVREQIAKYIVLNLRGVKNFFLELFRTPDTDKEVASYIAEYTKEVMENLGVEVIELKEIIAVAEEVCNESFERSVLARGCYLRNRVSNWLANTDFFGETGETVREWVKNPTTSFRSCVVRGYNDFYDRGGRI